MDRSKVDAETKAFLAVAEATVDSIEFSDLTSRDVGVLGAARFGEYLAWREDGGAAPVDSIEDEPQPSVSAIPDLALMTEEAFQKSLVGAYDTGGGV